MKQRTLAMMTGFEQYTRKTRRAIFLEAMEQVVPWGELCARVADETTVCKFRHLVVAQQLGEQILGQVNLHLQAQGVRITTGTIVDATILHAPTSTKNREQQRDPEMHQTKKGKQWYFGMKAH